MTTTTVDGLVDDYLRRLDAAAAGLPADRRGELLAGIREHIDAARAAGAAADEAAVRSMLDRLGPAEEIVAAAADATPDAVPRGWPAAQGYAGPAAASARPGTGLELAAVLLLTVGSFVPVLGWLAGVVCLWSSRRWVWWEKLLGTLVVPFGPFGVIAGGGFLATTVTSVCSSGQGVTLAGVGADSSQSLPNGGDSCVGAASLPAWADGVIFLVLAVAPVVVAVWLYHRATRRAEAELTGGRS